MRYLCGDNEPVLTMEAALSCFATVIDVAQEDTKQSV